MGLLLAGMQQAAAAAGARLAPEPLAFATDLLADAAQSASGEFTLHARLRLVLRRNVTSTGSCREGPQALRLSPAHTKSTRRCNAIVVSIAMPWVFRCEHRLTELTSNHR